MAVATVDLPAEVITIPDEFLGYPLESFSIPDHYRDDLEYVFLPAGMLRDRTQKLAADIFVSYPPGESITLVCVLKSGLGFFNALMAALQSLNSCPALARTRSDHDDKFGGRHLSRPLLSEFVRVSSYIDDHSTGNVQISGIEKMAGSVTGKNVILLDDMIDTGATMKHTLEAFAKLSPKSLKATTLLRKRCPGATGYIPDFLGFDIPDRFVVGFSIDYNQYFRDCEHLCVVNEVGKRKYASGRVA
ncbi:putative Hypoxanthine-guanine phosphoribosyltransferase [Hypsibius exemplaris]|uniref:Hypoxanthine-guanine phosphoribosyltransferase n=1 Tax=Hypsibius exemplaris TaxID=2072580 RepID=A0A1W0X0N9_HYPEX|nr:putative Hypoxanthine-guanine phosphoribosyltransferase [Hypsibius exemplaris]